MNLDNNRVVAVINSRETEDVQAVLDTFPNLKYLPRDRGKQYQKLSTSYIHIADRFHIIKNVSDNLIKALQKTIPYKCIVEDTQEKLPDKNKDKKIIEKPFSNKEKTLAHKNKIALIEQVRAEYEKSSNIRATARFFKMSKTTVKRYLSMKDVEQEAAYDASTRSSNLDPYKDIILKKYQEYKKITEVHNYLLENGIKTKYNILNYYIKKHIDKIPSIANDLSKKKITVINRRDIINEVFNWKNSDDSVKKYINELKKHYPIIKKYQSFYKKIKDALTNLDAETIEKLFNTEYNDIAIDSFLENAKNDDYAAIINSAKYKMNNGILEGTVNKIKAIKKAMYGRCSIELLSAKVLYQSINYQ